MSASIYRFVRWRVIALLTIVEGVFQLVFGEKLTTRLPWRRASLLGILFWELQTLNPWLERHFNFVQKARDKNTVNKEVDK